VDTSEKDGIGGEREGDFTHNSIIVEALCDAFWKEHLGTSTP